jgi:hypothetical protein
MESLIGFLFQYVSTAAALCTFYFIKKNFNEVFIFGRNNFLWILLCNIKNLITILLAANVNIIKDFYKNGRFSTAFEEELITKSIDSIDSIDSLKSTSKKEGTGSADFAPKVGDTIRAPLDDFTPKVGDIRSPINSFDNKKNKQVLEELPIKVTEIFMFNKNNEYDENSRNNQWNSWNEGCNYPINTDLESCLTFVNRNDFKSSHIFVEEYNDKIIHRFIINIAIAGNSLNKHTSYIENYCKSIKSDESKPAKFAIYIPNFTTKISMYCSNQLLSEAKQVNLLNAFIKSKEFNNIASYLNSVKNDCFILNPDSLLPCTQFDDVKSFLCYLSLTFDRYDTSFFLNNIEKKPEDIFAEIDSSMKNIIMFNKKNTETEEIDNYSKPNIDNLRLFINASNSEIILDNERGENDNDDTSSNSSSNSNSNSNENEKTNKLPEDKDPLINFLYSSKLNNYYSNMMGNDDDKEHGEIFIDFTRNNQVECKMDQRDFRISHFDES